LHKDILTVFILKYYLNMELIDTPNPNAKKILIEHNYEVATYINKESEDVDGVAQLLIEINGVDSVFMGPGFLTITRDENANWDTINNDISNKFDTI
jgi:2-keto-3-deoxy-L-rhamnonate aldolase RhmA